MHKDLELFILNFLKGEIRVKKTFILGFSGGCDSMALFYLLIASRKSLDFSFYAVYINHGWREESFQEEQELKSLCEKEGIPFISAKLDFSAFTNNLEDRARQKRLEFFAKVYKELNADALLLAHHADDLAETVIKRVFEGSHFFNLQGLKKEAHLLGMQIIRPLLDHKKLTLKSYLKEKGKSFFEDRTNFDSKYLRSRMRLQLLPKLEESFGKNITDNIVKLSHSAATLSDYMHDKIKPFLAKIKKAPYGTMIDLSEENIHQIEVEALFHHLAKELKVFISRPILEQMSEALISGVSNKQFSCSGINYYIDRKKLFLIKNSRVSFSQSSPLKAKTVLYDSFCYSFEVKEVNSSEQTKKTWKECWGSSYYAFIPITSCSIVPYQDVCQDKELGKKMRDLKIPAFLKSLFPYIKGENGKVYDFFSGIKSENCLLIKLEIIDN